MEWIWGTVLAVTFGLLCYTVIWVSVVIHKKGQPIVDAFLDAFRSTKPPRK